MKTTCLALVLLLVGCGGRPAVKPAAPAAVPAVAPLTSYYPMLPGTAQAYTITSIAAAHWDFTTHEVVIDGRDPAPNPHGAYLVQRYDSATCAAFPAKTFSAYEWNFQNSTTPRTGPLIRAQMLGDAQATSSNGIAYIGEQIEGTYATQSVPEPLLTVSPVAGEEIHENSTVSRGCDDPSVRESDFLLDYSTVRHLDTWKGYSDLWQTSLVEHHADGRPPLYYNYFFARDVGMVGFSCWTDAPDHFSCGNEYIGVH